MRVVPTYQQWTKDGNYLYRWMLCKNGLIDYVNNNFKTTYKKLNKFELNRYEIRRLF